MSVRAADVAAALRERLPDLPIKKLHKLLYYCQGHHLAHSGSPLFSDAISAFDMGPVVGGLWHEERDHGVQPSRATLGEAELNTIGYVVSRYGSLSGRDLEILTHHEDPWLRADHDRSPGSRVRIEREWLNEYFSRDDAVGVTIPRGLFESLVAQVDEEDPAPVRPDTVEELRALLPSRG